MKTKHASVFVVLLSLLAMTTQGAAQGTGSSVPREQSADEVARELANPNNWLASLTFKNHK